MGNSKSITVSGYDPTDRQKIAHGASHRYKLFGGAMGGGKSRWLCEEINLLCLQYPGNRILMARYHLTDFKNTTLKTLLECVPEVVLVRDGHNKSEHIIRYVNGSEILYMGLSEESDINKLKSMELGAFGFDEASEIPETQFLLACSRLRRMLPSGKRPAYFGLLTSNPEDCWLKDRFIKNTGSSEFLFIPSLPKDNPYLPDDYEDQLRKIYPQDWVQRYLEGNWDDLTQGNFVIPRNLVDEAVEREIVIENKPCMGIDVARGVGGDETSFYIGKGGYVEDYYHSSTIKTDETSMRAQRYINEYNIVHTCIDDIGIGAGVTDMLSGHLGINGIEGVNVGKRSDDERFFNMRSELWWWTRDMFADGKVSLPKDEKLVRQLGAVKYKVRNNGKLMLELKTDTKSRIGQSPDRADALILMLWASRGVPDLARDFHRNVDEDAYQENTYGWNEVLQYRTG